MLLRVTKFLPSSIRSKLTQLPQFPGKPFLTSCRDYIRLCSIYIVSSDLLSLLIEYSNANVKEELWPSWERVSLAHSTAALGRNSLHVQGYGAQVVYVLALGKKLHQTYQKRIQVVAAYVRAEKYDELVPPTAESRSPDLYCRRYVVRISQLGVLFWGSWFS